MLAEIGINTSRTDAVKLSIDSSKLDEALSKNFDSVKNLLSDGYTSKTDNGSLAK
jgi:flagellar capping protein FliD